MTMDVKIEKLIYGGEGLGHQDGHTVFVPYVLPGEVVSVEPVSRRKKFIRGRVQSVVTPSPERATARCPHFGVCGGCHYQHIPYAAQLRYKQEIFRETLARLGKIEWTGEIQMHAAEPYGYRNRAQWRVRSPETGAAAALGYHEGGSTRFCAIEECAILSPLLARTLERLRELFARNALGARLLELEAFADAADGRLILNASLESFSGATPVIARTFREALPEIESLLLHDRREDRFELDGPGFLRYPSAGFNFRVGHLSFFQVNRFLLDDLARSVAGESRGRLALDLFAGVGFFSMPLATRFERVVAVEANEAAARDLEANASAQAKNIRRHAVTVEKFLASWHEMPDLIVLDPPRAGVMPAALERLGRLTAPRITYLSCDPATMARDLAVLMTGARGRGGYEIRAVHLFDLFPQTYHIEALVELARRE